LKAGLWVRRARFAIIAPDRRHSRRSQAEIPLIGLSEFARPPLFLTKPMPRLLINKRHFAAKKIVGQWNDPFPGGRPGSGCRRHFKYQTISLSHDLVYAFRARGPGIGNYRLFGFAGAQPALAASWFAPFCPV
jgi:hypothetical protein